MAEGEGGGGTGVLRELLAVFGFGVDTEALKKGETALGEFFEKVKKLAEGVAAVFAVEAIGEFVEANVKAMAAIEHAAVALGISADEVQAFQFAARSLGLEADALVNSMGRLQVAQQAAGHGAKTQAGAFGAIGVKVRDQNGHMKEADQLFVDVAEGISKIKDPSKQAAVAVQLFGRQGRQLLPILKEGAKGIDELIESYHELGGGYSEDAIKQSATFEKQSAKLSLSLTGLKNIIMRALLPVVTKLVEGATAVVQWLGNLSRQSSIVQVTLAALGGVAAFFALQMLIAAAPIVALTLAIAALLIIVEDIYTFLRGGKSETGEAIDAIFGKGQSTKALEGLRDIYREIADWLRKASEYVQKIPGLSGQVGDRAADILGGQSRTQLGNGVTLQRDRQDMEAELKRQGHSAFAAKLWAPGMLAGVQSKEAGDDAKSFLRDVKNEGQFGPEAPPGMFDVGGGGKQGDVNVNMTVNGVHGTKQEFEEHARRVAHEVVKARNRAAHATVPRKPGS